jgi:hypothetical protein
MLSTQEYIRRSTELNLFFARIMKEHLIFAASALTPRDTGQIQPTLELKNQFEGLLAEALSLANKTVSPETAASGEFVTPFTLRAEQATQFYTAIPIASNITQAEMALAGTRECMPVAVLEQRVSALNQKAIALTTAIVQVKRKMRDDVLSCRMFTHLYPLLLDHVLREALFYLKMLRMLERRDAIDSPAEILEQELFWNRIMAEHSKFIRGLLDPTEDDLIQTANHFACEFDMLTAEAKAAIDMTVPLPKVTGDSLRATEQLRNFKAQGAAGILDCKVKSIILPLLADHVLREANHYLHMLRMFGRTDLL